MAKASRASALGRVLSFELHIIQQLEEDLQLATRPCLDKWGGLAVVTRLVSYCSDGVRVPHNPQLYKSAVASQGVKQAGVEFV